VIVCMGLGFSLMGEGLRKAERGMA
jgi:hypothetical protein